MGTVRYDVAAVAAAETFMLRLAVVLMVAGLGASGYAIVFPPPLVATVPRDRPGIHGDYETSVFLRASMAICSMEYG